MTVASEIERIELAKSDIKYSIENKWVTVPSSVKIDLYHNYIDQISASASWLATWITTYAKVLASWVQYGIQRWPFLSWDDNNWLYWLCTYAELPSGSESYWVTFFSKVWTSDIQHFHQTVWWSYTYNPVTEHLTAYKQWNLVRAFFTSWSTRATYCWFTSLWDMSNNSVTTTCVWSVDTLDTNAWWYDMTWWTEITGSTWVQDITTERNDSTWSMYLTLKLNSYPRKSWMNHLVTATAQTLTYYSPDSQFSPISREYDWIAYAIADYHWYTGSSSFKDNDWIMTCKITPTTWISWATLVSNKKESDHRTNRSDTPSAWSVWRNANSTSVQAFLFLNQPPSSSYPQLNNTYCYRFLWDTTANTIAAAAEVAWTLYDYDPTNYGYDLTGYTQVTSRDWATTLNMDYRDSRVYYSFNIKDDI